MIIVRNCSNRIEPHILVQLNSFLIRGSDLQEALLAPVQFKRFHRRDHEFSSDPSSTKVGQYGYRYYVSLSDHAEASEVGEAELESAHYVSDNLVVALCNDEGLRTALVDLHEKVCTVVFWKTDPVYLDD